MDIISRHGGNWSRQPLKGLCLNKPSLVIDLNTIQETYLAKRTLSIGFAARKFSLEFGSL